MTGEALGLQVNPTEWGFGDAPERAIVGELAALLFIVMVPVAFPLLVGLKVTVSTADWPLDRVVPPGKPLTINAGPEAATPETVTLELPVFVTVEFCVLSLPTATSPKLRVAGFAVKAGVAGVVVLELEDMTPEQPVRPGDKKSAIRKGPTSVTVPRLLAKNRAARRWIEFVFI